MKKSLLLVVGLLSALPVLAQSKVPGQKTRNVTVGVNEVYIPSRQNHREDAYVVASGFFPNGCYHWLGADVRSLSRNTHEVTAKAQVTQGMCIMVLIPYSKEVKLGNLERGEHQLRFMNGDGTFLQKTIKID